MNFTDEQIEKLGKELGRHVNDCSDILNGDPDCPWAANVPRYLRIAQDAFIALLRRIEQDEKREDEDVIRFRAFGEYFELNKFIAARAAKGVFGPVAPDPLSLPAKEREWITDPKMFELRSPDKKKLVWITVFARLERRVVEDWYQAAPISPSAIAYMPRVEGEEAPPLYLGPIPAVDGWEGER